MDKCENQTTNIVILYYDLKKREKNKKTAVIAKLKKKKILFFIGLPSRIENDKDFSLEPAIYKPRDIVITFPDIHHNCRL